jgi:hypothetical protein
MLTEKELQTLDKMLLLMRIINLSLAAGVAIFAGYILIRDPKLLPAGSSGDVLFAAMGAISLAVGWLVAFLFPVAGIRANPAQLADADLETCDVVHLVSGIQVRMIVASAIFEGAALANLFWFMIKHDPVHLAVAAVLWISILLQFPRKTPVLESVERGLRQKKEERAMTGSGGS